jgi:hypothetical protein
MSVSSLTQHQSCRAEVIFVGGASPAMRPIAEDDLHRHAGTAVINRTRPAVSTFWELPPTPVAPG